MHKAIETLLIQQQKQQQTDSLKRLQLWNALQQASGDKQKTKNLEEKIRQISFNDSIRKAAQLNKITELKKTPKVFL